VAVVVVVNPEFVYQVNVPLTQVAVSVALAPSQIDGVFKAVGVLGIGVTVIVVLADTLLQVTFELFIQIA
jgi:hypothetical protein